MITIEVAGVRYEGWQSASVFRSIETVSGKFDFATTAKLGVPFPIQSGAPCSIYVDAIPVMRGYVDEVSVSYDSGQHSIAINGRDRTADLIDSTIGPGIDFHGPVSLQSVIQRTLENMGLSTIKVIDQVGSLQPFSGDEIVSAEIDKTGFEFIESYSRQRQIFLTTDGAGNIVIARAGQRAALAAIVNDPGNEKQTNIKEATYSDNRSERYGTYIGFTQESATGKGGASLDFFDSDTPDVKPQNVASGSEKNKKISTVVSQIGDDEIRASRRLHVKLEEAANKSATLDRASWERNTRRGKGLKYSLTLQGFYQDDAKTRLWLPNELVSVTDVFCDIRSRMLVWSCEWEYSIDSGSITKLECVPPEAVTLEPVPKKGKKKKEGVGEKLKWYD